ncbi:MAG TPA: SRPBCC family protein [Thermoleophilaceae bacterium]|nr:SRPBCC family protein [Thermoleophilaceae bacterium]
MSIDVLAEVQVRRPREQVAAYMTDPANDPEWIGGLREARLVGDGPVREGSRVARVASFLGRRVEYLNEITRLEPGVLEMRSVQAPFPMHITYTFEPHDGGTVVRNHVRGGGGWLSLGSPAFAPLVRRSVQKDLERLRDVLER